MKHKRIAAIAVSLLLIMSSIAACGNSESIGGGDGSQPAATDNSGAGGPSASEDSGTGSPSAVRDDSAAAAYNVTWDDTADIVVMYPAMSSIPSGLPAVEAAINEITEKEINTHVHLLMTESGSHDQQLNLMMSANEQLDLVVTIPAGASSFSTMAAQNQLKDITGLMETYAPTTLSTVGELIRGTQINGKTYGLTCYNSFASGIYIHMRTDVLEDLGLTQKAEAMTTFTEFEELMAAVKASDKWNYLAGIVSTDSRGSVLANNTSVAYADKFADCTPMDNLGNTQAAVAVQEGANKVINTFASKAWKANNDMVKAWYDKGYVYKDSATTSEMGASLIKSNVSFAYMSQVELGAEAGVDDSCGMDMTSVMVTRMPITTSTLTKFTWVVPNISKEPEAAVTFLEMMFTDPRVANLLAWGVEGVDYEVGADGVAGYIAGNEDPAYHTVPFLNPNKFIVRPWTGDDPKLNELALENMAGAIHSPYLGFAADTTAVTNEISAITNVIAEYQAQLVSGSADAGTCEAFLDKLAASGIQKVVDLYQEQLDRWLSQVK